MSVVQWICQNKPILLNLGSGCYPEQQVSTNVVWIFHEKLKVYFFSWSMWMLLLLSYVHQYPFTPLTITYWLVKKLKISSVHSVFKDVIGGRKKKQESKRYKLWQTKKYSNLKNTEKIKQNKKIEMQYVLKKLFILIYLISLLSLILFYFSYFFFLSRHTYYIY